MLMAVSCTVESRFSAVTTISSRAPPSLPAAVVPVAGLPAAVGPAAGSASAGWTMVAAPSKAAAAAANLNFFINPSPS